MSVLSPRIYELSSHTYISLCIEVSDDWPIKLSIKNKHGASIPLSLKFLTDFVENEDIKNFYLQEITVNHSIELSGNIIIDFIASKAFKAIRLRYLQHHVIMKKKAAFELFRIHKVISAAYSELYNEKSELPKRASDVQRHLDWIKERRYGENVSTDIFDVIADKRFTKNNRLDLELAVFYVK